MQAAPEHAPLRRSCLLALGVFVCVMPLAWDLVAMVDRLP